MSTVACHPFLHRNKPSRESIFCGKVNNWWTKRALIVLNFLLKTRQNKLVVNTREWATARKTHTLAAASASGCRACCSQTTGTVSWEGRSNWPQTSGFLPMEIALNNFRPITFLNHSHVLPQTNGAEFHVLSYPCSARRACVGCILVLRHKDINSAQFVETLNVNTTSW